MIPNENAACSLELVHCLYWFNRNSSIRESRDDISPYRHLVVTSALVMFRFIERLSLRVVQVDIRGIALVQVQIGRRTPGRLVRVPLYYILLKGHVRGCALCLLTVFGRTTSCRCRL